MNCAVFECGDSLLVLDCGVNFPDVDTFGIDVIIPDFSWLEENAERIVGLVITHGHMDHIGAVPYLLALVDLPIYAPDFALRLIRHALEEHDLLNETELIRYNATTTLRLGPFTLRFHPVNHSIPDTFAVEIETPIGTLLHSADFKMERQGYLEPAFDIERFRGIGDRGVRALLIDSTNVERDGWTRSEAETAESLLQVIDEAQGAVFVTLFSTNVFRMKACVDAAVATGKKLLLLGRSLQRNFQCAVDAGHLRFPSGSPVVDERTARGLARGQLVVLCTGSQGQPRAALPRMARRDFSFEIRPNDSVVFSARPIPGNEREIGRLLDDLARIGAIVVPGDTGVHCSGHACRDELAEMIRLVRPTDLIPVHGEYRFLVRQAELARSLGVPNPIVMENGDCIEFQENRTVFRERRPVPRQIVDQDGPFGALDGAGLRHRQQYARRGLCLVWLAVSSTGELLDGPHVVDRGGLDDESLAGGMLAVAADSALAAWESLPADRRADVDTVKDAVRGAIRRLVRHETGRRPLIEVFVAIA